MLFDLSPGETNAIAFLLGQALRWAGVVLFLGIAWGLGRRLGDWRIFGLAVAAVLIPAILAEVRWNLVNRTDGFGRDVSRGQAAAIISFARQGVSVAALAVLIVLSAKLVAARRGSTGPVEAP